MLSPFKFVIPVAFTLNPDLFSWKFLPILTFEYTNTPAERSEGFFSSAEMVLNVRTIFMSGSKIQKWAYIGGCLGNIGPFESERSDGVVW